MMSAAQNLRFADPCIKQLSHGMGQLAADMAANSAGLLLLFLLRFDGLHLWAISLLLLHSKSSLSKLGKAVL